MAIAVKLKQGELAPTNSVHKKIIVELDNTTDTDDTHAITLSEFGCTKFVGIHGQVHTTEDSVIVDEEPATAVSAGVLTITVGGTAADNLKRTYEVTMR